MENAAEKNINQKKTNEENAIDVNDPPAQDSPKHILNALNDFCIQLILRHLDNVRDLLSAAEVCTRFQENAKQCYRQRYKAIRITKLLSIFGVPIDLHVSDVPPDRLESFLSRFGHLIHFIKIDDLGISDDGTIFDMIAQFCGKTLRVLETSMHIHSELLHMNTWAPFQALEALILSNVSLKHFCALPQLQYLCLECVVLDDYDELLHIFRKLQAIKFIKLAGLTNSMFIEFMAKNRQLKSITINGCSVTTTPFRYMARLVPHLVHLTYLDSNEISSLDSVYLGRLQEIRFLNIDCVRHSMKAMVDLLAKNDAPIEDLVLRKADDDYAESIPKLKYLRRLLVSDFTNQMIIDVIENTPNLEEINIENFCKANLVVKKESFPLIAILLNNRI